MARAGLHLQSALRLTDAYADLDAERRFAVPGVRVADPKACQCGEVLKGVIKPWECKVFGTACTPEHPIGTCMVSPGGRCAAYYNYGRFAREREECRVTAVREERILGIIETARAKRPRFRDERITMAHGAGGKATQTLIEGLLAPAFGMGRWPTRRSSTGPVAITTDSFVVKPLGFPGGSIGELAVNGTVNDLAMAGARPLALSLALILEEGLDADVLRAEVEAIAARRGGAGVEIVAGDTKVVERGHADGMYVCTTGIGARDPRAALSRRVRPGDRILVSGTIGEHGTAIMLARGEFGLDADIESDTRSLWPAVDALLERASRPLPARRHPRRRGLGAERARARGRVAMLVREGDVPVEPAVAGAAELLGIDPMYVANEGKLVAFVAPEGAAAALGAARGRGLRARRRDRRGARPSRRAWCWSRPRSAGGA